tara:strand:- start:10563 stop:13040 length:2478 start_codon:yes stop_codon:yes gene_type:complete
MATFLRDDSDLSVLTGVASTTVGSIRLTGTTIGLESDTDLLTLGSSLLDVNAANIHFNGSTLEFKDTSTDATTITLTQSTGNISCASLTSTGDLTVSGGKITFGNSEFISNETDNYIQLGNSASNADLGLMLSTGENYDSRIIFTSHVNRWSVGYDASDTTDHPLLFNQGLGALGANTKMKLAQDGDLEIAGDLTVTGNKITFGAGGVIEEESSGAIMSFTTEAYYAFKSLSGENLNMFFYADNLEDNSDSWNFEFVDGGDFKIKSGATGGYVSIMELTNTGNLQIDGKITISGNIIEDNDGTDMITFDSSGNSTLAGNTTGTFIGNLTGTASNATLAVEATNSTIVANNSADETVYPTFVDGATGTQGLETDTGLTYNPSTGMLTSTGFTGALTGNSSTATEATNVTVSANNTADETVYPVFVDGATGTQGIETDTGLTYNPNSGVLTSTNFTGALTGNAATATHCSDTVTTIDASSGSYQVVLQPTSSGSNTTALGRDDYLLWDAANHILTTEEIALSGTDPKFTIHDDDDTGDYFRIEIAQHGATTISTVDDDAAAGHLTLDIDGDITLDAQSKQFYIARAGTNYLHFNMNTADFKIMDTANQNDYFNIGVDTEGATTISTVDADTAAAHLTLDPDGDLIVSGADVKIDATQKLYLDGGGDTYISESNGDVITFTVGGLDILTLAETVVGDYAKFDCGVGFDQKEPTYNAADTNVLFDSGNKQFLTFGSGNIADLNLHFPSVSGNYTLLLKQDGTGSRTVAADGWLVFDQGGSAAAGSSTVKWAGGSPPTLTTDANHVDILSFYWDSDNEIAYGVATLDFQF